MLFVASRLDGVIKLAENLGHFLVLCITLKYLGTLHLPARRSIVNATWMGSTLLIFAFSYVLSITPFALLVDVLMKLTCFISLVNFLFKAAMLWKLALGL